MNWEAVAGWFGPQVVHDRTPKRGWPFGEYVVSLRDMKIWPSTQIELRIMFFLILFFCARPPAEPFVRQQGGVKTGQRTEPRQCRLSLHGRDILSSMDRTSVLLLVSGSGEVVWITQMKHEQHERRNADC